MEQGIADQFNRYMEKAAVVKGARFSAFSLGGQDRDAGADYLLSDASRFALVEFKASHTLLKTERKKPRRETLCRYLSLEQEMRDLHDVCHYITFPDTTGLVLTNIYRNEICNAYIFPALTADECCAPSEHQRVNASSFANGFFNPNGKATLGLEDFERYLHWVMTETSGSTTGTISLLIYDPYNLALRVQSVPSVAKAYDWMQEHRLPPPAPSSAPSGPGW